MLAIPHGNQKENHHIILNTNADNTEHAVLLWSTSMRFVGNVLARPEDAFILDFWHVDIVVT